MCALISDSVLGPWLQARSRVLYICLKLSIKDIKDYTQITSLPSVAAHKVQCQSGVSLDYRIFLNPQHITAVRKTLPHEWGFQYEHCNMSLQMLNELQTISKLIETASLEENPLEMLKTSYLGEKQHYFCLVWFFLVVIPDTHCSFWEHAFPASRAGSSAVSKIAG